MGKINTHTPQGAQPHELVWLFLLFKADPWKIKDRYLENESSIVFWIEIDYLSGPFPASPLPISFSHLSSHP